jgi:hypothetical protein
MITSNYLDSAVGKRKCIPRLNEEVLGVGE